MLHWTVLVVGLFAASGCSDEVEVELFTVSGTVMMDGKPLEGATVVFVPEKSTQPQPSWGYSDASGKYSLKTADGYDGIEPGTYRIVISKLVMKDGSPIPSGTQTEGADGKELVPYPHSDPRQTKNVADVTKDGEVFDVAITTDPSNQNGGG